MLTDTTEPTFADRPLAAPGALQATPEPRAVTSAQILSSPARGSTPAAAAAAAPLAALSSSESIGHLIAGLAAAQLAFTPIARTQTADVDSKRTGVKYSYDYADLASVLASVRPALAQNGVAIVQAPLVRGNALVMTTFIAHTSGEWMRNDLAIGLSSSDPQTIGSAITYARRYALQALLGVAPEEDDDGAAATPLARRDAPAVVQPQRASQANGNGHGPARELLVSRNGHGPARELLVSRVEPKQRSDGMPFWQITLSDGRVLVTPSKEIATRVEGWSLAKTPIQPAQLVTRTQGAWTILDEITGGAQ